MQMYEQTHMHHTTFFFQWQGNNKAETGLSLRLLIITLFGIMIQHHRK